MEGARRGPVVGPDVEHLLVEHYDPAYSKSIAGNFRQAADARSISIASDALPAYAAAARELIG